MFSLHTLVSVRTRRNAASTTSTAQLSGARLKSWPITLCMLLEPMGGPSLCSFILSLAALTCARNAGKALFIL